MERFVHGGNIYEDTPADGWLDFSANINPLGLPASAQRAMLRISAMSSTIRILRHAGCALP